MTKPDDSLDALVESTKERVRTTGLHAHEDDPRTGQVVLREHDRTGRIAKPDLVPCPFPGCVNGRLDQGDGSSLSCSLCYDAEKNYGTGTVPLAEAYRWQWEQAGKWLHAHGAVLAGRSDSDVATTRGNIVINISHALRAEADRRFPKQSKEESCEDTKRE